MLSPAPMPFKINRPAGSAPRLTGFSLLGCTGPEAADFLQAQTMNDVRALAESHWHWNGWLNAKGRVIALFALLKLHDEEFIAVLPDFPASELMVLLQRFVFRAKLRLHVVTDLVPAADPMAAADDGRMADEFTGDKDSGLRLDFSGASTRRHLLLLPEGSPVLAPEAADCDARWLAEDLAHGLPRLGSSQRESWTPQMLSLQRLHAFSLKKGCYPGQEIVARTHYLGQARRSLSRITGSGIEVGATVEDVHGSALGSVISAAHDASSGLAVLAVDQRPDRAVIGTHAVALPDLLGGLERSV